MSIIQKNSVDLGVLGEDEFKRLCSLSGLISNASTNDRLGWDFLVEIPPQASQCTPLDRQPSLQKILFQIKSTKSKSNSVRGKLSAFKYLSDTELPAFIAHKIFDEDHNIVKIRILHIGRKQIEAILSRVRKAESEGRIDLHKMDISLSLNDAVIIEPDREGLIDAISQGLNDFGPAYGKAKMDFRAACGFDRNSISANFSFFEGVNTQDLVDLMLGLRKELPISHMTVRKRRFGIALDNDNDHMSKGSLTVQVKPFQTGYIKALSADGLRRSELLSELFTPNIPDLDRKKLRIRIKNDVFDVILHLGGGTSQMSFSVDVNQVFELGLLSDILNFGTLLCEEGTRIFADFPALKDKELPIPEDFIGVWRWRLAAEFLNLIEPAKHKSLKHVVLSTCLKEVEDAIEMNRDAFASLARPGLTISSEKPEGLDAHISRHGSAFIPSAMTFQDYVYQAIGKADATWEDQFDGTIKVVAQRPIIIFNDFVRSKDFRHESLNNLSSSLSSIQDSKDRFSISLEIGEKTEMVQ